MKPNFNEANECHPKMHVASDSAFFNSFEIGVKLPKCVEAVHFLSPKRRLSLKTEYICHVSQHISPVNLILDNKYDLFQCEDIKIQGH